MATSDSWRADPATPGARRTFVWVSLVVFLTLAAAHTWPLASAPGTLSRNDTPDTQLHEWTLGWLAHQVVRDPLNLFDANIFHPDRLTLAYSDHLLVPGLVVAPLLWVGVSPVLAYNLLLMAGFALTGWSMCLVMYRWTGSRLSGLLSGSLVAFNAFTLTRMPQIQDQHLEFLPLALWALDRLLSAPSVRRALTLAAWFVLQALTGGYWLLFTTVGMVAGAAARPGEWLWRSRRVIPYALLAGAVAGLVLLPLLLPYWVVSREQGLVRSLEEVALYSARLSNYLSTGGRLHFDAWSQPFYAAGGDALFPGVTALGLTLISVGSGVAFRDTRARMALAFGGVAFALSFGPALPGYALLHEVFPLMAGIRGASRFGQLFLVGVAILSGFAWMRVRHALAHAAAPAARAMLLPLGGAILIGVHLEAARVPVPYSVYQETPAAVRLLERVGDDAVLVFFPFHAPEAIYENTRYMLYTARSFAPMLNGYSGFTPPSYLRHAAALRPFSDPGSVDYLRAAGVTHVVVERARVDDAFVTALDRIPALQLIGEGGGLQVYRLRGPE